ncbi:MAG: heme exporter protein CcmB [Actinobacteria bacterium]|nr:heme exporter protein CcmB [Actinomycetota bacterium]
MLADALIVVAKDLRIEWRSRVGIDQLVPFALVVLVLFAFALDSQQTVLAEATPGLLWVTILLALVLCVQRIFVTESAPGLTDQLRLSGLDPAGIFLGKALGVFIQLLALEVLTVFGAAILYSTRFGSVGSIALMVCAALVASVGLAAAGALYGALLLGVRGRETLLPLLLLPVVAPVLIGATSAFQAALGTGDVTSVQGWRWVGLLAVFAVAYVTAGIFAFGPLLEDT